MKINIFIKPLFYLLVPICSPRSKLIQSPNHASVKMGQIYKTFLLTRLHNTSSKLHDKSVYNHQFKNKGNRFYKSNAM